MAEHIAIGDGLEEEKKSLRNHADHGMDESTLTTAVNHDSFIDDSYVKIIDKDSSQATDVSHGNESTEFACLKKEDLLKYATDPFWVRVRVVLLVLFGLAWVGMLAAAIAIIVLAPKCPPQPELDWWQKSIIYHIHPQSFMDSNGDGFGDIKGMHEKIDYLKDNLHVGAVCIGPMNPTPNFEYSYNIVNYNATCPHHYGSVTDLDNLRLAFHKKGIKVILDFIPNHTSRKHKWFISSANMSSIYRDYYVWNDGRKAEDGTRQPPNNWLSVYGGSAWTYNEQRKQYYYHTFSEDEPDLNLRNAAVLADLDASLKMWLNHGVDGFRFHGVQYLVESANTTHDEPLSGTAAKQGEYDSLKHDDTAFQPESYDLVVRWRKLLDDFSRNDGKAKSRYYPRLMIVDVNGTAAETVAFSVSDAEGKPRAHIATNKALVSVKTGCRAHCLLQLVTEWYDEAEKNNVWSNWQLGNVDASRVASRVSEAENINALNLILLTLPGTSVVYYGEELGMKDISISADTCQNSSVVSNRCRLLNRAPMQWSDEPFAGFTKGNTTWLPVNNDYYSVNVKAQLAHGSGVSTLTIFSNISELRQEPSFQWGKFYPSSSANVFYFIRQAEGFPGFLVAANLGPHPSTVDFTSVKSFKVPPVGRVVATTGYFEGAGRSDAFRVDTDVMLNSVFLKQGEGIVFRWQPEKSA